MCVMNDNFGCTLFCMEVDEMINTIQLAMNAGLVYTVVRNTIFTHPFTTEAFNDVYSLIDHSSS